ncbi:hypothetical protein HMPREF1152_0047 [Mogibacterium sp. CM50]|uniref:Uncharacterized protein n=1 Tax=Mogibacterium timidum ATCC 33093 TaxID=1401079 RepID=X8ISF5_9FIRM|nr:hypothetical protein HMPREF1152_0047 [Mogibacterium sp. CM50]EUC52567.1 hypothetical protein HMPREF0581_1137 [Mogibacterium timidum ATCC 33093]
MHPRLLLVSAKYVLFFTHEYQPPNPLQLISYNIQQGEIYNLFPVLLFYHIRNKT